MKTRGSPGRDEPATWEAPQATFYKLAKLLDLHTKLYSQYSNHQRIRLPGSIGRTGGMSLHAAQGSDDMRLAVLVQ
jgi:hypothetical protein